MHQINTLHCWNGGWADTQCEPDWSGSLTEEYQGSSGGCESPMIETKTTWDLIIAPLLSYAEALVDDLWISIEFQLI